MTFIHCDDYIDDVAQPQCLRAFLDHVRSPAHGALRDDPRPRLFADYKGKRVRVVMASRFGDVGITADLNRDRGYDERVAVADLSNFAETPSGHANSCAWHCDQFEPDCDCGKRSKASGERSTDQRVSTASAIEAATAGETPQSGSAEGESAAPQEDAR